MKKALVNTFILSILIICLGVYAGNWPIIKRIAVLLGADVFNGGFIQLATWFVFFLALGNIKAQKVSVTTLEAEFKAPFMPRGKLLYWPDINKLHKDLAEYKEAKEGGLVSLLSPLLSRILLTQATELLSSIVDSGIKGIEQYLENQDNMLGYYIWTIPSLGFIGTVYGISLSLSVASSAEINTITSLLGVAFDTTLLSLILSVIVNYRYHQLFGKKQAYIASLREYVYTQVLGKLSI